MSKVLLIGTGPMAIDYCKVLQALGTSFSVVGRGEASAIAFTEKTGIATSHGGIQAYLENNPSAAVDAYAIVATGTEALLSCVLQLIKAGVKHILVEKPAAVSIGELLQHEAILRQADGIYIAYNRRFYSSVTAAAALIREDGGLLSMHFEFTEWAHRIDPLVKAPGVKENWFFANSTHVVDTAFYLAGAPEEWKAFSKAGNISWHAKANFTGAGITGNGVLFSYLANWESAGRWGIELLTAKRRIYLKPLEELHHQMKGSLAIEKLDIDNSLDVQFKPGLYKQVSAFMGDRSQLLAMDDHLTACSNVYQKMLVGN